MLSARRRARIIEHLRAEGMASLRDLAQALDISLSTVRRDVDYLHQSGHLQRTRGGVILETGFLRNAEPEPAIASALADAQKRAIGALAATMIRPGQTVIFDSGTTTGAAALAARDRGLSFTAVTNDLHIGAALSTAAGVHTTVTGGYVRAGSPTLIGAAAAGALGRLRADIAFVGAHGVRGGRLWDTSIELAEVKRAILGAAERVVLLADAGKFGADAFCAFGDLRAISLVVTDDGLAPDMAEDIRARDVAVELASPSRRPIP